MSDMKPEVTQRALIDGATAKLGMAVACAAYDHTKKTLELPVEVSFGLIETMGYFRGKAEILGPIMTMLQRKGEAITEESHNEIAKGLTGIVFTLMANIKLACKEIEVEEGAFDRIEKVMMDSCLEGEK